MPVTGQEREVFRLRYGLADGYTHTLEEVGQQLGITPGRVREIEVQRITGCVGREANESS